jgi:hypothetical protein
MLVLTALSGVEMIWSSWGHVRGHRGLIAAAQ